MMGEAPAFKEEFILAWINLVSLWFISWIDIFLLCIMYHINLFNHELITSFCLFFIYQFGSLAMFQLI